MALPVNSVEYTTQTIKTLKANMTVTKPHYVQKVISARFTIKDAFKGCFRSDITIFIPKHKPDQNKPCVLMAIKNGAGKVLIRFRSPIEVAMFCDKISSVMRTDKWLDNFQESEHISSKLAMGDFSFDEAFVDVYDYKEAIIGEDEEEEKITEVK